MCLCNKRGSSAVPTVYYDPSHNQRHDHKHDALARHCVSAKTGLSQRRVYTRGILAGATKRNYCEALMLRRSIRLMGLGWRRAGSIVH